LGLRDVLWASLNVSVRFSWIAILIACFPSFFTFLSASTPRRWYYASAGLLGGLAGEFCGAGSLFLSLFLSCRGEPKPCNSAQGDMGLLITLPLGSFLGSLIALGWTWTSLRIPHHSVWASVFSYSGPNRIRNWIYAFGVQMTFWVFMTWLLARLMA
jgi:hypothetical protein